MFSITRSSGPSSSSSLREKLSVDSTQRVTTGMPISSHHSTKSRSLSAPARYPATSGWPGALVRAQRRLPSASTATCRGNRVRSSSAISRCSYVA
jgi:hypothetical protein